MQMNRLLQVKAGQDGKDISLQYRNEEFQTDERDVDGGRKEGEDADARGEATEDRQHGMAGQHVGEEADRQGEWADEIGKQFDRHQQQQQDLRDAVRHKEAKEMSAVANDPDRRHKDEDHGGKRERNDDLAGRGVAVGNHS